MLIQGSSYTDERGILSFVNDFNFDGIKRFYTFSHPNIDIIRAWQGHKIESKYFFCTKGKFLIAWVEIDNWDNPGKELKVNKKILSEDNPQILVIPPGNANGFKAIEADSKLIGFSNLTLEESKNDDYRFPVNYWSIL
jgi:dTDP-4-dehydrorhamnose 3,5-epimerase-like enzyme